MPNRIIKESIHESERLNGLSNFAFRVWVNLLTYVDDYGRGDARTAIIKGNCFPLCDKITAEGIEEGLLELEGAGCIVLYTVKGRRYLCFPGWERHQRVQQKRSKYPAPEDAESACESPCVTVDHRDPPPESESKTESEEEAEVPTNMGVARLLERYRIPMSSRAWEEMRDFMGDLPLDVIEYAINEAVENNKASWRYVRAVLARLADEGVKSVEEIKRPSNDPPMIQIEESKPQTEEEKARIEELNRQAMARLKMG